MMKMLMDRSITLLTLTTLVAIGSANAGQPLYDVLKLRTIEVLRCEAVTGDNVAEVSSFLRVASSSSGLRPVPSEVVDGVSGFLVEGILKRQRNVEFPNFGEGEPIRHTKWSRADSSEPLTFFVPSDLPGACETFVPGERVTVVLSQRADCDTFPPEGICAFDHPIRLVDPGTRTRYGE